MTQRIHLACIKIFLVGASIFLLAFLLWKNIVPRGRFSVSYEFQPTPFISSLRPAERLTEFKQGYEQSIIGDPVYFDIRLPSNFENIEIVLKYKNESNQKFTIATFTDRQNWKFKSSELVNTPLDDGLVEGRARFFTEGLDSMNRTTTFILGAPEASSENPITMYGIDVHATKQPLTWKQIPLELWEDFEKAVRRVIASAAKQSLEIAALRSQPSGSPRPDFDRDSR